MKAKWGSGAAALVLMGLAACGPPPGIEPPAGQTPSAAPSSAPTPTSPESPTVVESQWTFTVVRHAERDDDGSDDPPLTTAGANRAVHLSDLLSAQHGVAVYATAYQRTQSTARPTAAVWNVPVSTYDGQRSAPELIAAIKSDNPRGAILIVGHSETVPGIVTELCACTVGPIDDSDFGELFHIEQASDGTVVKAERTPDYGS